MSRPRGAIKAKLFTFALDETPDYYALSYTWGDAKITHPIEVDGHPLQVTANLLSALRRLQLRDGWEYLWVDAICIDQKNDDEKSQQVPLMVDIYKTAVLVFMWLGEEQHHTSAAISFIQRSCDRFKLFSGDVQSTNIEDYLEALPETAARRLLNDLHRDIISDRGVKAIQQFLQLPYWSRVWVLQEAGHANSALILCGRHEVSFHMLIMASLAWTTIWMWSVSNLGKDIWHNSLDQLNVFRKIVMSLDLNQALETATEFERRVMDIFAESEAGLLEMFFDTRTFKSSEPRDKVYALLNLLRPGKTSIKPDYRRPETQVYRDMIITHIKDSNNLSWISAGGVGAFPESDDLIPQALPSWVPNFRLYGDETVPQARPFCSPAVPPPRFHAAGSELPKYTFSPDYSRLIARGFICDRVIASIPDRSDPIIWFRAALNKVQKEDRVSDKGVSFYSRLLHSFIMDFTRLESPSPFGFPTVGALDTRVKDTNIKDITSGFLYDVGATAFSESELSNPGFDPSKAGDFVLSTNDPALSYFILVGAATKQFPGTGWHIERLYTQTMNVLTDADGTEGLNLWPPDKQLKQSDVQRWQKYILFMKSCAAHGAFLITQSGYMGLARQGTREGDLVAILHGCEVPIIIRPDGDDGEFVIVGDSYIHGAMEKQMIEKQENGMFALRDFTFK
jgi:hypothetical protein